MDQRNVSRHRLYPFNAEQTVNILSEFGPLVTMFVVNALYGINAGTWALITTTVFHGHDRLRRPDADYA
jgi:intracellular septation protein